MRLTKFPIALAILVAALVLPAPHPARADGSLINKAPNIAGPVQVHLVYPDKDGNQQDVDLASAPQPLLSALPGDLQQLHGSPLLTSPIGDAFGQLWSTLQGPDCGSVVADIQRLIWGPLIKDFSGCSFSQLTSLTAIQQSQWPDPDPYQWAPVSGQRLLLDYWVPDNTLVLKAASGNTTGEDEQFTLVFDIHVQLMLTAADPTSFPDAAGCPYSVTAFQYVTGLSVMGGDHTKEIGDIITKAAQDVGGGDPEGAAKDTALAIANLGLTDIVDAHLRDDISGHLVGFLTIPGPVDLSSASRLQGFNQFDSGCKAVENMGVSKFDASATPDGHLRFTLTHPANPAPSIVGDANAQPRLQGPVIAASDSEVKAGDSLAITGNYFSFSQGTQILLSWYGVGTDSPISYHSEIKWGPKGGQLQTMTVDPSQKNFSDPSTYPITGLTPGTTYQFQVRDCDPITCTPWSAENDIAAGGSNQVTISIDSAPLPKRIGNGTLKSDGTFSAAATIPPDTAAGKHTIYAVTGDVQPASQGTPPHLLPGGVGPLLGDPSQSAPPSPSVNNSALTTPILNPSNAGNLPISNLPVGNQQPGGDQQASTTITVVGGDQKLSPTLEFWDAQGHGQVQQSLWSGSFYSVHGSHFTPGGHVKISVGTAGGTVLTNATVGSDGTFTSDPSAPLTAPSSPTTAYTLVATEVLNGQTLQATDSVPVAVLK